MSLKEEYEMCLMSKDGEDEEACAAPETNELDSCTVNHFTNQFKVLEIKINDQAEKLKIAHKTIESQRKAIIAFNKSSDELRTERVEMEESRTYFRQRMNNMQQSVRVAESRKDELEMLLQSFKEINNELTEKASGLEAKLYKLGQTEQTIFLNKPKEFRYYNSKMGLGYDNPHNLENVLKVDKAPCLYKFEWLEYMSLEPEKYRHHIKEEEGKEEEIRRKTTVKMQLPFVYEWENRKAFKWDWKQPMSDDYLQSYVEQPKDCEKPLFEGSTYYPPLILQQKLIDIQLAFDLEKEVLYTVLTNSQCDKSECSKEKKSLELKCLDLSNQLFDFQKTFFLERQHIGKERAEFDVERKSFETKFVKLSNQLSDLEKTLEKERRDHDFERKESEKLKVEGFQTKCLKHDFEKERKIFQNEIKRLTKNLSGLSVEFMQGKKVKSGFQRKFDVLSKERNILSNKVKELEDIIFKVEVSKQASPDTIVQTPLVASTGSECSFRTASSSINTDVSSKGFDKSKGFSKDQIRPSNLFYNHSVDKSDASTSKPSENLVFKRVKMVWKVKGSTPERDAPKSSVPPTAVNKKNNPPKGKFFVKPNPVYSANHLIRLAQKQICCSYCGTHDFVKKEDVPYWYGTYNIPSNRAAHNKPRPKFLWVPKST